MISFQSLVCLVVLTAMGTRVSQAVSKMPESLPKQTVAAGSTVQIKATDTNGFKYRWCVFGYNNESYINPSPALLTIDNYHGDNAKTQIQGSNLEDKRVSFTGDLNVGKAWFQISKVEPDDSRTYELRCYATDGSFFYPKMELEVKPGK